MAGGARKTKSDCQKSPWRVFGEGLEGVRECYISSYNMQILVIMQLQVRIRTSCAKLLAPPVGVASRCCTMRGGSRQGGNKIIFYLMNVFIYGVPGSGKTTLAKALSSALNIEYFEADLIRRDAQKEKTLENEPFFFLPTTEAYKGIGERTQRNVIDGMLNVRLAFKDSIDKYLFTHSRDIIIESAFLDPGNLKNKGIVILLTISAETKHKKQFLVHRTIESFSNGQFENARMIQNYFISEASRLNIPIIDNDEDIESLIERVKMILEQVQASSPEPHSSGKMK